MVAGVDDDRCLLITTSGRHPRSARRRTRPRYPGWASTRRSETAMGGANSSGSTHRVLMSCCSSFLVGHCGRRAARGEVVPHRRRGQPARDLLTQGPGEGSPPHREVVTLGRGVQVRPSPGCGGRRIGHHGRVAVGVRACGHPQQLVLGGSLPASDAGPDRPREGDAVRARRRPTVGRHRDSTLPVSAAVPEPGGHAPTVGAMWFEDRFSGPDLDREVWFPHYLPAWSSRAATAASYRLDADGLTLDIPVDHPRWCPGHAPDAAAGVRRPVGQLVRAARQHARPAALRRRPHRPARSRSGSRAGCRAAAGSRSRPGCRSRTARWPRSG